MATMNLTAENFQSTVEGDGLVLIDFWAAWCGPCRAFGPVFEKVSERHTDVTFAKVDTEAEQALAGSLGISSIPTLMIFRENVLLFAQPGALPENALENLVEQAKNLDMNEVRAQIDKQKAEATQ